MRFPTQQQFLALAAVGLLLAFVGCSEDEIGTPDSYESGSQTIDLDDSFGGLLPTDEDPAFGDSDLASSVGDEQRVENGYEGLSAEQIARANESERDPRATWFSFTALWGHFGTERNAGTPDPPEQQEEIIWDGSMELTRGGIKLLSVILFEREHGDRVLPRSQPELIEWESRTLGHHDGLRVLLTIPPDTTGTEDPVQLTFRAGEYERVFDLAELDSLHEEIAVGESAAISFRSFQADPAVDVRGFLGGRWGRAAGDSVGRFHGHWVSARDGRQIGWVRGHYGVNDEGERVFFGKYIDWSGGFRGLLRGHYDLVAVGDAGTAEYREDGQFRGEWIGRRGEALGRLNGTWTCRGNKRGSFRGMWQGNLLTPLF